MRKLKIYPDEVLKKKCRPVKKPGKWHDLISEMKKVMVENQGVGLAAPQVGETISLFLMDEAREGGESKPASKQDISAYFNPEILNIREKREISEACLSFPDISIEIERGRVLAFRALNRAGEEVEKTVTGLQAQCVKHESEHLRGVTLADHASLQEKMEMQKKLKAYRKEHSLDA